MSIDEKAIAKVQDQYADINGKYKDMSIRSVVEAYLTAKSAEQPVGWSLSPERINDLQHASIERTVKRCKQAHFVDVRIRINGDYEYEEADWIKHLKPEAKC